MSNCQTWPYSAIPFILEKIQLNTSINASLRQRVLSVTSLNKVYKCRDSI